MLTACQSRPVLICFIRAQSWFHTAQLFTFCTETLMLNVMALGVKTKLRTEFEKDVNQSVES